MQKAIEAAERPISMNSDELQAEEQKVKDRE